MAHIADLPPGIMGMRPQSLSAVSTPGAFGLNDRGDPDLRQHLEQQNGSNINSRDEKIDLFEIRFHGFDGVDLDLNCKSYKLKIEPKVEALDVKYDGWGMDLNDGTFIYHFFLIHARIEWDLVGTDPTNSIKAEHHFETQFLIRHHVKSPTAFAVTPGKLGMLKWTIRGSNAAKSFLEGLPMVLSMKDVIEKSVEPFCRGETNLIEELKEIFEREVWKMKYGLGQAA